MLEPIRKTLRDREMMRTIFTLAGPTVMENALQTVVSYADTAQVGAIGAQASASVGLTATMLWLIHAPISAMGMAVLSCISRARGANDLDRARRTVVQAAIFVLILGAAVAALTLSISPFLPKWLGAAEEIQKSASTYFAIVCMPMLFRASSIIFAAVLRASGNTKTPMFINTGMNFVNITLNFLFINPTRAAVIFGRSVTIWGAGLGVTGAAIATAIAYVLGGTAMFLCVYRNPVLGLRGQKLRLDREIMRDCVRIGSPIAAAHAGSHLGQVVFTALIARLGTIAIAAHSIAITAEQAFYVPGYGMQAAAATLAGHSAGAKDREKLMQYSSTITFIAACLMGTMAVFLFLFPHLMMGLFTPDAEVIALGAKVLRIVAVSEPFYAILIILEGTFHGVGETKIPFVVSIVSMWGVRILLSWICVAFLHLGLTAVWICMVADNLTRFACLLIVYRRGNWYRRLGLE